MIYFMDLQTTNIYLYHKKYIVFKYEILSKVEKKAFEQLPYLF